MKDDIRKKVRAILQARGWTTRQLANEIGASVRTVEGWLFGRTPSSVAARAVDALAATIKIEQPHAESPTK